MGTNLKCNCVKGRDFGFFLQFFLTLGHCRKLPRAPLSPGAMEPLQCEPAQGPARGSGKAPSKEIQEPLGMPLSIKE